jgi:putative DNA primase/helicase
VSFRGREDRNLYEKLKLEWPGILKWAIEGCLKWQKEGLEPVGKVKEWTNSYRAESDIIEQFLEEKTEKVKEGKVQAQDLYQAYKLWCQECGEYSITGTMFGKRLQEKGYEKRKTDRVYYLGLKLAEDIQ